MRNIPKNFDSSSVAEIDRRLRDIANNDEVIIPLAIESGSRAWGFPSPDSDYDCRFVYVRSPEASFTLFPRRDVIETPLTPVIDVNGWELSKALKLMLAGNAVILEWLTSPIVYHSDEKFRLALLELADSICDKNGVARHYFHLARNQFERSLGDGKEIGLKKIFYSLRPVMALRWMRLHPDRGVAPMHFPTLCQEADLSAEIWNNVADLMARKALTREMGKGDVPAEILSFLVDELQIADKWTSSTAKQEIDPAKRERVDRFWRQWVTALYNDDTVVANPWNSSSG